MAGLNPVASEPPGPVVARVVVRAAGSRTNTPVRSVLPGTRLLAFDRKATAEPSAEIAGLSLGPSA